jgi:uncharacterized protein YbaR (Trm112 family)
MVLIFGWGSSGVRDLGEVAPLLCPNCHNNVFLHQIKSSREVSLYFIPLVPYATDEYLACPICHAGLQIQPAHRQDVSAMIMATRLWRSGQLTADDYRSRVERFWPSMGMAVDAASVAPRPASAALVSPPSPTLADQLAGLAQLRSQGTLTEEEFTAAKSRLLRS